MFGKVAGKVQASHVQDGIWTPATAWQDNLVLYEWGDIVGKLLAGSPDGKPYAIGGMYLEYENVTSSGDTVNPTPTFDRRGGVQASGYWENLGSPRDYLRVKLDSATVGTSSPLASTATVTFTAYAQINYGDKVTLRATFDTGTDIDFTAAASGAYTWDPGSSNNAAATALAAAIDSHASFSASAVSAVVTITQSVAGLDGNTAVTLADTGDPGMTKTDFAGGGPSATTITFTAQSAGAAGEATALAFDDTVNSLIYGCALVAYPDFSDKSQDLVLSRYYFPAASQIEKASSSNIGITWPITLS